MVKKLFKHEYFAYARVMPIVYIILLTIAAAGRIIQFFENDSVAYTIVSMMSFMTYGVSVFAALAFGVVFGVIRFYKNLFSSEGYLSFTLPVSATQHILVKAVTAVSVTLVTVMVVLLSGCIITAGEMLTEIWNVLIYILRELEALAGIHVALIGCEYAILILLVLFADIMMYYIYIAIGQLFKKNRILAAVGAYFVHYVLAQIASTVLSVIFSMLAMTDMWAEVGLWVSYHPYEAVHIALCGGILLYVVCVVAEFIVIRTIITKRLNLE